MTTNELCTIRPGVCIKKPNRVYFDFVLALRSSKKKKKKKSPHLRGIRGKEIKKTTSNQFAKWRKSCFVGVVFTKVVQAAGLPSDYRNIIRMVV